ncbi:MAG: HupE/UreJ family protein [Gammaproteobacteria bacterium]|nr:HupE/UreJ family protein [Gammaproteobacteria bacterium]
MRLFHVGIWLLFIGCYLPTLQAHQLRPALVSIEFTQANGVQLQIKTNAEALLAGIGPGHEDTDDSPAAAVYRELRQKSPDQLSRDFADFSETYQQGLQLLVSGQPLSWRYQGIEVPEVGDLRLSRQSVIRYQADYPATASTAQWAYAAEYGANVVSFVRPGLTDKTSFWLESGQQSPQYSLQAEISSRHWTEVTVDYLKLGFLHILPMGTDHILFVLGLFLLSQKFAPLLWQVTAFTVAHSITLALSIYGLISLPSSLVETLIALSIVYVGVENILTPHLKPWRIAIVFGFGLLHGMGFAGVLTELGLPESEFINALISFNIGVELGQISVILLALVAVFWIRRKPSLYRNWLVIPGSSMIALMGLFWTWQRISLV